MAHITIRNIGPIKEVDIDLNKVNVFMGAQSSGKSTIAKIICHCQWVEKKCFPTVGLIPNITDFYNRMIEFYRLDGYFNVDSSIIYQGDYVTIKYNHKDQSGSIEKNTKTNYQFPIITYIPSERNIVSAIPNLKKYNETNDAILYFMYDWFSARENIKEMSLEKVIQNDIKYTYSNDKDYIVDNGKKILVLNASSGIQSLTPLMLVLKNNLEMVYKKDRPLSYEQMIVKDGALRNLQAFSAGASSLNYDDFASQMKSLSIETPANLSNIAEQYEKYKEQIQTTFNYHLSKIFLEEPEQNLFPETQIKLVYWLGELLKNGQRNHQLTLTTHSPYILFSLNNCMMGGLVENKIPKGKRNEFESSASWIDPKKVSIYEIVDGKLRCIQDEDGIIEDNYLNQAYKANSAEYLSLLNYYDDEE